MLPPNSQSLDNLPTGRHVVVVGAGVVGCATAYRLARSGFAVTLIERDAIAAHASGNNAGNLNPLHGTPPALVPAMLEAFEMHATMRAELAQLGCHGFSVLPVKRVHLGHTDSDRRHLEETAALCNSVDGFSATWLDRDSLRQLEPRLAPDINFAVLVDGGLSIDSYAFTRSLAAAAEQLGAAILSTTVTGIEMQADRLLAVDTNQGRVPCDEAVFATGPWVTPTMAWLGIDIAVEPVKGELLLVRLPEDAPLYDFTFGSACLYRRRDNEIWIGGTTVSCGLNAAPTPEAREFLLDGAARIMPEIRRGTLLGHVAALRPMSVSKTSASKASIACRARGWQNVYIANGGGAKGVLLSAEIAAGIRDLLLDGNSLR
jgi:glycine/D-amino acid oxidase-like deaminating enzyme